MTMEPPAACGKGTARPRPAAFAAARRLAAAGAIRPTVGVVLGTGLGGLADRLIDRWSVSAAATEWLVNSTATGHAGRVVGGRLPPAGGAMVEVLVLQGRVHAYEGHAAEVLSRGVELLAAAGATTILLTNAAGGLRPDMRVGDLVVFRDHVDLVRKPWTAAVDREAAGKNPRPRETSAGGGYDAVLGNRCLEAARLVDHPARAGVYALVSGPSYETRAEYRMLRKFGADVVGMSTVPEAVVAGRLGLSVTAVSVVTNVARPDAPDLTDAEDVCQAAAAAAEGVWAMIGAVAACGAARETAA
jgi:purine-nucleoside phosphorylase